MGAIAAAAAALKIGPPSLQNSVNRAKVLGFPPPNWKLYQASKAAKITEQTPDTVRTRNQISDLQKRLNDALEYASKLEDIRKSVFNLQPDSLKVPGWAGEARVWKVAARDPDAIHIGLPGG